MRRIHTAAGLLLALSVILGASWAAAAQPGLDNFVRQADYPEGCFTDVTEDMWSYSVIQTCYEYGLMQGRGETFDCLEELNAAEALTMADRVHSIYQTGEGTFPVTVPWFDVYLTYAQENGLCRPEDFPDPLAPISRADMAYVFAAALPPEELAPVKSVESLPDEDEIPARDREAVFTLYRAGVLLGNDPYGTFSPNATITRQEAAAILARVAIPDQRRPDPLLQRVDAGPVVFGMPQGGQVLPSETDTGSTMYRVEGVTVVVDLYRFTDSALRGRSITDILTPDQEKAALEEKNGAAWMEDCRVTPVAFGPVTGYRTEGRYVSARYDYPMFTCRFITDADLYRFTVTWNETAADPAVVERVCSSLTVNGEYAVPLT